MILIFLPYDRCQANGSVLWFFDKNGRQVIETTAEIIEEESFKDILDKNIVTFIGEGSKNASGLLIIPTQGLLKIRFPFGKILRKAMFSKNILQANSNLLRNLSLII